MKKFAIYFMAFFLLVSGSACNEEPQQINTPDPVQDMLDIATVMQGNYWKLSAYPVKSVKGNQVRIESTIIFTTGCLKANPMSRMGL